MIKRVSSTECLETHDILCKDSPAVFGKEVKVFQSIDKIGRDSLDSISDDPFFTYGWFKTLETQQSFAISPIYIAVYDEGSLIAFAPCFIDLFGEYFYFGPRVRYGMFFLQKILNLGHKLGFCQNHVLLCYSPFCDRSKVLLRKSSEEKLILSLLSQKIDDICKKKKFLFSSFLFVSEFDRLLMENLQNFSYLKSPGVTTLHFDVQWSNFEDYLKSLGHNTRHNIRREMKKFRENGVTIEEPEFGDLSVRLSELISNLHSKYNKNSKCIFSSSLFSKLSEYNKDKTKVFVARKNNELIGFCLFMQQGATLDAWMCGFNYDVQTKTDFTYFNLGYYAPIQWAIEEGYKKIYYRRMAEKVKLSRGCKPEKTYSFTKCHNNYLQAVINNAATNPHYSHLRSRLLR